MNKFVGKCVVIAALSVLAGFATRRRPMSSATRRRAEGKVAMCIGCHGIPGYRTAYPEVYRRADARRPERAVPRKRAARATRRATATSTRCTPSPRRCRIRTSPTSPRTTPRKLPLRRTIPTSDPRGRSGQSLGNQIRGIGEFMKASTGTPHGVQGCMRGGGTDRSGCDRAPRTRPTSATARCCPTATTARPATART